MDEFRIVSYDIDDDKVRNRVSKYLLQRGFMRIQFSVFVGKTETEKWDKSWNKISSLCSDQLKSNVRIFSFTLSSESFKKMQVIGEKPDVDYLTGDILTLFV